jgi:hypothetical protein
MKKVLLAILLVSFCAYWWHAYTLLDPDFGWHIRNGQNILHSGFPYTDHLSYTMPHYPVIAFEWLNDVLYAFLLPYVGILGISGLFAAVLATTLVIQLSLLPKTYQRFASVPLILCAAALYSFASINPQVTTIFCFSILLHVLQSQSWRKYIYLLPLLFVFWVNAHGGFAFGIVILLMVTLIELWQKSRYRKKLAISSVVSLLATFCNPYGVRIWQEVWMTITDASLRWTIHEWKPTFLVLDMPFWIMVVLSGICMWCYRKRFTAVQQIIFIITILLGVSGARHIALFVIPTLTFITYGFAYLYEEATKQAGGAKRFFTAQNVILYISIVLLLPYIFAMSNIAVLLSEQSFYPSLATVFLREHPQPEHIFTTQEWAGYLVWKIPQSKAFITGQMPIWKGHTYPGDSPYAYHEYRQLIEGKILLEPLLKRYPIRTILLPTNTDNSLLSPTKRIDGKKVFMYEQLHAQLMHLHWKILYQDNISRIYIRP